MITAYINGKYFEEPLCSPFDLGFLRGYGVFENFRTYNKYPLFLEERLQRLAESANTIQIPLLHPIETIREIVFILIEKNGFEESNIRLIATKGKTLDGINPIGESSLFVLTSPFHPFPKNQYEMGVTATTTRNSRFFPKIKSLHYLPGLLPRNETKGEILYLNEKNELLEGITSNLFFFQKNQLLTSSEGILSGLTRKILLKILPQEYEVIFRPVSLTEISKCDEAFLTSSLKEIVPLVAINNQKIGQGVPGPRTKQLMELFGRFLKLTLDQLLNKSAFHFDRIKSNLNFQNSKSQSIQQKQEP